MIENYIQINRAIRSLHQTVREIMDALNYEGEGYATAALTTIFTRQLSDLERLWPNDLDKEKFSDIEDAFLKEKSSDYWLITSTLLPDIENLLDSYFTDNTSSDLSYSILDLLHPRVIAASYSHFKSGNYREAVLNSIVAAFDLIRERTGIDKDGSDLVGEVFSLNNPILVMSSLGNKAGENDQKGFMQMLKGVYQGVRSPKAHTLTITPTVDVAAQYLVFASLLCRRIEEADLQQE